MELILIIIGGLLAAAILVMVADWMIWRLRARAGKPFEQTGYDGRRIRSDLHSIEHER